MLGSTNPALPLRRYRVSRANFEADALTNILARGPYRGNIQSFSVWSFRLLLWPGAAVDGGVRNASKRSFTIA
jgi:hypothetical protein